MSFKFNIRNIIISLLMGITLLLLLSGCTTPYEDQVSTQQDINQSCDQSDVLLADLSKPESQRLYSVKPGETCYVN